MFANFAFLSTVNFFCTLVYNEIEMMDQGRGNIDAYGCHLDPNLLEVPINFLPFSDFLLQVWRKEQLLTEPGFTLLWYFDHLLVSGFSIRKFSRQHYFSRKAILSWILAFGY
ncbi:uncharacterized protein LOC113322513 [Papaver somniferum]|uniref:uncharacterized protein LOC113322513 n=1 Tax=Papaver somniferum TaxID=3469 RepID=UPI000E7020AF|nr:uncharacterized protein LOC113322513 [Papaver somniferum]